MKHMISLICLTAFFALLIVGCSKAPGSVIEDFYNAKTWDERKAFILDANGLKEKDVYDEEADYKINEIAFVKAIDDNSSIYKVTILKAIAGFEGKKVIHFLITKINDVEKIDFKTMYGINEVSLKQYIQLKTKEPKQFWVKAYLDKKYLYPVGNVDVVTLSDESENVHIAIMKESETVESLIKLREIAINNKDTRVLVEIAQVAYEDPLMNYYYVGAKNVKILKLSPLSEE